MKKQYIVLALLIIIAILGISFIYNNSNIPNESKNLNTFLSSIKDGEKFDLSRVCEICDSVYIIKPYDTAFFAHHHEIKASSKVKDHLISLVSFNDGMCLLLFLKDCKVTAYAEIPRTTADFANINQNKIDVNTSLFIDKNKKVYIK